ncbi:MAG: DUF885 domain-containing protein [Cyclobacteriaceae bacterium]|nr:DUF885 domain-containing protein [Cyclobacteriaceae bacterium]
MIIRFVFLALVISACTGSQKPVAEVKPVDTLFHEFYEFKKRINPIEATKAGFTAYNDQVANYISTPYKQELIQNYQRFLEEIARYDSTRLSESQWMSLQVMKWDCELKLEGLTNSLVTVASPMYDMPNFELMPLLQIQSLHLYFSQLAGGQSLQPFQTVEDYDRWLRRVDAFLPFLDTAMVKMREGLSKGLVLPKVLIERMIPQIEGFATAPVKDHLFFQPIAQMPAAIPEAERERLTGAYTDMVTNKVAPKYKQLQTFLRDTYLPAGRATDGLLALPNGPETFQYLIKYFTTTDMTAAEIHELGKQEVARIRGEMEAVRKQIGFNGDLKAFFDHVRSNRKLMPFRKPEEVIANFNKIRDRVEQKLPELFELKPKGGFEVRRTEAFREASASAEFLPGSKDGSRPGIFYVPIRDVRNYNTYADEALFLHEAVPGHYYQLTLQQENAELPEFLHPESISVFVEGWALYAESLGKELGLYEDPYQYLGMLSMEMHRAIRLVLETGIHAQGWTREQAIQYSLENEAESLEKITVEVERYMATPGAALCYKVGQLKIRELRTRAESALGEKFNIREFHSQVLNSGSLPLQLLEKKINAWIARVQRGAATSN